MTRTQNERNVTTARTLMAARLLKPEFRKQARRKYNPLEVIGAEHKFANYHRKDRVIPLRTLLQEYEQAAREQADQQARDCEEVWYLTQPEDRDDPYRFCDCELCVRPRPLTQREQEIEEEWDLYHSNLPVDAHNFDLYLFQRAA